MRRLAALLVALALTAAPVAAEVCQATCAEHEHAAAGVSAVHHSCHEAEPVSASTIGAGPHFCGHDDSLPTAVAQSVQPMLPPAVIPTVAIGRPPVTVVSAVPAVLAHSPPGLVSLVTHLRV